MKVRAAFTQAAVARVLRAVKQVGMPMAVKITPDGEISVEPIEETEIKRRKNAVRERRIML